MEETLTEKLIKLEGITQDGFTDTRDLKFKLFDVFTLVVTKERWHLYEDDLELKSEALNLQNKDFTVGNILKTVEPLVIERRKDRGLPDYLFMAAVYGAKTFKHRDIKLALEEEDLCVAYKDDWTWVFFKEKPAKEVTEALKNDLKGKYSSKARGWYFPHRVLEIEDVVNAVNKGQKEVK